MARPTLTAEDIRNLFPEVEDVSAPISGGQKLVFPCRIGEGRFVIKVLLSESQVADRTVVDAGEISPTDEVFERAKREVSILQTCDCDNLPKIGPIGLQTLEHGAQHLIAFSEEFVAGRNLPEIITNDGPLENQTAIQLGEHLNSAVEQLWAQRKIHRDIKPQNILRCEDDGRFVLLDPGIAFDLDDASLTGTGLLVHTKGFIAPELTIPHQKRDADCRSDFFLIGIVLYLATTGLHPFITSPKLGLSQVIANVVNLNPTPPHVRRAEVAPDLSNLIMRLLAKHRHRRFRNCAMFQSALVASRGA